MNGRKDRVLGGIHRREMLGLADPDGGEEDRYPALMRDGQFGRVYSVGDYADGEDKYFGVGGEGPFDPYGYDCALGLPVVSMEELMEHPGFTQTYTLRGSQKWSSENLPTRGLAYSLGWWASPFEDGSLRHIFWAGELGV